MRLKELALRDFGPFRNYTIQFNLSESACLLLTGKNNEGKSHILFALKLVNAALRVLDKQRHKVDIDGVVGYALLKQDVGDLTVGRLVYNYGSRVGKIVAAFRGGFKVTVYVDPSNDAIYASSRGRIPATRDKLFGFMPPLGQLASREEQLSDGHLRSSLDTTLAPRHFRNHVHQTLNQEERALVSRIISESWEGVAFLGTTWDWKAQQIDAFYREDRIEREVSWAGQGLQVWFQIVAHMVRLREHELLVLDEPEINLHAEKQHDLIRLLREYHTGSVLIATHSVELMNDVGVSHIIHVQKNTNAPALKSTEDRTHLELVRSSVGSDFNLVASQFEAVDAVIFTEDREDFKLLQRMAGRMGFGQRLFGIPLHGFSEHPKAKHYRDAYDLLIGRAATKFTVVLDRDYYPPDYLAEVSETLHKSGIRTVYTPGKEMENLFLAPGFLRHLLRDDDLSAWLERWEDFCEAEYIEALGSAVTLYAAFSNPKPDNKTATKVANQRLQPAWASSERYREVPGKRALKVLRGFYRERTGANLSQSVLLDSLVESQGGEVQVFLEEILHRSKEVR